MKIKAYQIAPEYQEAPLCLSDDVWEGLEICGNRDYKRHTSAIFDDVVEALEYGDFDNVDTNGKDVARLEALCDIYGTRGANDEAIIAEALSIVTGEKWEYKQISGCCQSDWNIVYYRPKEWTIKALEYFEVEYFNTGEEWRLEDEEGGEWGYSYTHEWKDEGKRQEIAEKAGVNADDVTLYRFDGWTKTANYKEI